MPIKKQDFLDRRCFKYSYDITNNVLGYRNGLGQSGVPGNHYLLVNCVGKTCTGCSRKIDRGCQAAVCVVKGTSVVFSCFNQQNILLQDKVKSMLILEYSDSLAGIGRGSFPFQESQLDIGGVRGGEPSIRLAKYFKGII